MNSFFVCPKCGREAISNWYWYSNLQALECVSLCGICYTLIDEEEKRIKEIGKQKIANNLNKFKEEILATFKFKPKFR